MRKKITLTALVMLIIMSITGGVQAYRSTYKDESVYKSADTWIKDIRKMESTDGELGLLEEINEDTLVATTDSNNIDVHLLKNTEYGAILLLGASDYGKQGASIEDRYMDAGETTVLTGVQASTTGNRYGIYEMGYYSMTLNPYNPNEWVAAGLDTFLPNIASRYIDRYTLETASAKPGDATVETDQWHGSSSGNWVTSSNPGFRRGYSGAFYFNGSASVSGYGRAGVVVGAGF